MIALFKKEIRSYLSSLIGYMVIGIFLLLVSLFMWIFPGDLNIMNGGYANIDSLFYIAPWVFMFLIPAITMKFFAEEIRTGTIELLMTKPITEFQLILAKYLAALVLVVIAILPTFVFFFSVYSLGDPVGNIDVGGTLGSYIGLFFLAASYVAIGNFSSSLTSNQIVAFLIAVVMSLFIYIGFDSIGSMELFRGIDDVVNNLGIANHYVSMSRGLIDTRDIMYFIVLISIFILLTRLRLQSYKW